MKRKGFTLIELLVVIAIIAILAAILFPVFQSVRENARAISCVSNLKQIGLAMTQYTQDADEAFPRGQYYDTAGNPLDWQNAVYPYVKNGSTSGQSAGAAAYNGLGGVWSCPDFPSNQVGEYAANADICHPNTGVATGPVSLALIDAPTTKALVAEVGQAVDGGRPLMAVDEYVWTDWVVNNTNPLVLRQPDFSDPNYAKDLQYDYDEARVTGGAEAYPSPAVMPRYRHRGHCNVLYVDGHVKAVTKTQMSGGVAWYNTWYVEGASISGEVY